MVKQLFNECPARQYRIAVRNRGCHDLLQIIKAGLDHCNACDRSSLPPTPCLGSNGVMAADGPTGPGADVSDEFLQGISGDAGTPGVRKTAGRTPCRLCTSTLAGPSCRTLVQNGSACNAMIESLTMFQPGKNRAVSAAAGADGRLRMRIADTLLSGAAARTSQRSRVISRLPSSARAGETRHNAQQNAYRCVSP
jgi:hypothetical protein